MMGAAQLGALAALVVLFVPMCMAGWHMSRNKVLFFGGALFISLAVGVHLAPYFPSVPVLLLSSTSRSPMRPQEPPFSCIPFLHDLSWDARRTPPGSWDWAWSPAVAACGFQKLARADASDLLNGSWILVAGDSQARLLALALLRLLLEPSDLPDVESDLFRRHSDYHAAVPRLNLVVDFIWAPFESNLTALLRDLRHRPAYPDVLVMGSGLWHMLHVTNASLYGESLVSIKRAAIAMLSRGAVDPPMAAPHMFWLGLPALVSSMLNTEEKRARMNETVCGEYDQEVAERTILRSAGGPFLLLDTGTLSRGCGQLCTADGMHYQGVVYEAALQIMLNALLIESQQRL